MHPLACLSRLGMKVQQINLLWKKHIGLADLFLLFRPPDTAGFFVLRDAQSFEGDEAPGSPQWPRGDGACG